MDRQQIFNMLEGYAESYIRMGVEARVLAHDVAWDIRHNMIPALKAQPSTVDECKRLRQIIEGRIANMRTGSNFQSSVDDHATAIAQSELADVLAAFDAGEGAIRSTETSAEPRIGK